MSRIGAVISECIAATKLLGRGLGPVETRSITVFERNEASGTVPFGPQTTEEAKNL